jgi:hypothetical protein
MPAGKPPERPKGCECDMWSLGKHREGCPVDTVDTTTASVSDLEKTVIEMRRLGVTQYTSGGTTVILGSPTPPAMDDTTEAGQQKLRDEREKKELERKRRVMFGASARIGPPLSEIK